jgi:hypothetical protein
MTRHVWKYTYQGAFHNFSQIEADDLEIHGDVRNVMGQTRGHNAVLPAEMYIHILLIYGN